MPLSAFQTVQTAFDSNNLANLGLPSITMDIFSAAAAAAGAAQTANKRARTTVIEDPSSYQQHQRINISSGRKKRSLNTIIRSNLVRLDYTFKGLKDFTEHGFFWMRNAPTINHAESSSRQPIYVFAMNGCNQESMTTGNSVHVSQYTRPMRMLTRGASGAWSSDTIQGHDEAGLPSNTLEFATDHIRDVGSTIGAMGPRGYLNWTLFKLNLWGAKNKQTTFYVDICSCIDPDANPFRYQAGSLYPGEFNQHIDEIMRPLTVNPISTANNLTPSPWRVLKRIKVSIDPISSTEADQDPHCKTLKLFNRWGRTVDFKEFVFEPPASGYPLERNDNYINPVAGVKDNVTSVPTHLPEDDKLLFLVIRSTCYTRSAWDAEPSNTVNASFDLSFRSSWTKM